MKKNILIFGDSITYGAWDFEKGGWVERLKLDLCNKDILIYNLGIPGDNSNYLLERLENEIISRWEKEDGELIIIIAIGINDSQYNLFDKKCRTSVKDFEKNLEEFLKIRRKFTNKIIFIGLTKVNEKITSSYDEKIYNNKEISHYNSTIENFCKINNVLFIPVFNLFKNSDLEDGLHPNSQGHKKLFNKIKEFLIKNKII